MSTNIIEEYKKEFPNWFKFVLPEKNEDFKWLMVYIKNNIEKIYKEIIYGQNEINFFEEIDKTILFKKKYE